MAQSGPRYHRDKQDLFGRWRNFFVVWFIVPMSKTVKYYLLTTGKIQYCTSMCISVFLVMSYRNGILINAAFTGKHLESCIFFLQLSECYNITLDLVVRCTFYINAISDKWGNQQQFSWFFRLFDFFNKKYCLLSMTRDCIIS